jgi:hypothetical protein
VTADRGSADVHDQHLASGPPTARWALVLGTLALGDLPYLPILIFDDSGPEIIDAGVSSCH